jgi:ATP-dependent Clp protease ATP-binding subunit ClpA
MLKGSLTNKLTRAERLILVLYYYDEMTIKQIAEVLELSEARVSQMHSSIIARLKAEMNAKKSMFEATQSLQHTREQSSKATMFERFTDRAHRVAVVAKQEARRLNHEYIGTENLLLALVQEAGAVCRKIFDDFNITETKSMLLMKLRNYNAITMSAPNTFSSDYSEKLMVLRIRYLRFLDWN